MTIQSMKEPVFDNDFKKKKNITININQRYLCIPLNFLKLNNCSFGTAYKH